jgi:hypothetical protein
MRLWVISSRGVWIMFACVKKKDISRICGKRLREKRYLGMCGRAWRVDDASGKRLRKKRYLRMCGRRACADH